MVVKRCRPVGVAAECHPLALPFAPAYAHGIVKQPIINVEEPIERVVGRRIQATNGLSTITSNKSQSTAWQKALGGLRIPRGVYRFKTHEEADQWMIKMLARSGMSAAERGEEPPKL